MALDGWAPQAWTPRVATGPCSGTRVRGDSRRMKPRLRGSFRGKGTPRASSVCADACIFLLFLRDGGAQGLQDPMFLEGNGIPLQYSCLENRMDGGAWKAAVHGVAESRTRRSGFTFTIHFPALEKEMISGDTWPSSLAGSRFPPAALLPFCTQHRGSCGSCPLAHHPLGDAGAPPNPRPAQDRYLYPLEADKEAEAHKKIGVSASASVLPVSIQG